MPKIITITLNTAIDNIIEIGDFKIGAVVKAKSYLVQSGKGINVSRTVASLNNLTLSLGFVGEKEHDFFNQLESPSLRIDLHNVDGSTRTNVTILDSKHNLIIHTRSSGYSLNNTHISYILEKLKAILEKGDIVAISGSVPNKGVTKAYPKIIKLCHDRGIRVILDSNGPALFEGIKAKPFVVKPNIEELESLTSSALKTEAQIVFAAKSINDLGVEYVFVSIGDKGIIVSKRDTPGYWKVYIADSLSNFSGMEIGCGDAMVGAISVGLLNNLDNEHLIRIAIGCATANLYAKVPGKISKVLSKKFSNRAIVKYMN